MKVKIQVVSDVCQEAFVNARKADMFSMAGYHSPCYVTFEFNLMSMFVLVFIKYFSDFYIALLKFAIRIEKYNKCI